MLWGLFLQTLFPPFWVRQLNFRQRIAVDICRPWPQSGSHELRGSIPRTTASTRKCLGRTETRYSYPLAIPVDTGTFCSSTQGLMNFAEIEVDDYPVPYNTAEGEKRHKASLGWRDVWGYFWVSFGVSIASCSHLYVCGFCVLIVRFWTSCAYISKQDGICEFYFLPVSGSQKSTVDFRLPTAGEVPVLGWPTRATPVSCLWRSALTMISASFGWRGMTCSEKGL